MSGNATSIHSNTQHLVPVDASLVRYRKMTEHFPAASEITILKESNADMLISPEIKRFFGYTIREWLMDASLWLKQIHPEDRDRVIDELRRCHTSGEPFCSEYRFLDREKQLIWVRDEAVMVRGQDGEPEYLQGLMQDVTERKQAELALQESEAKLGAIFAAMIDVILVLDADGRYLEIAPTNPQLLYRPVKSLLGRTLDEVFPAEEAAAFQGYIRHSLEFRETVHAEYSLQVDGQELWFAAAISPMNENKVVWVARDITERKRIEAEMRQKVTELDAVNRISTVLRTERTLEKFLERFLEETLAVLKCAAGLLWLYDASRGTMRESVARGWCKQLILKPKYSRLGIVKRLLDAGEVVISEEMAKDERLNSFTRALIPAGWAGACVPIRTAHGIVGLLLISTQVPHRFHESEIHFLGTLAGIAGNAFHRMRLHQQTEKQLAQLTVLRTIDDAISSNLDLRVAINVLLDQLTTQLNLDAAAVLLLNKKRLELEFVAGRGFQSQAVTRTRFRLGQGYPGQAALQGRLIHVAQVRKAGETFLRDRGLDGESFASYYAIPLIAGGVVLGVLEIFQRSELDAGPEWLDFLHGLALQAAIAIEKASFFEKLQRSNLELGLAYEATIEGWSMALDLRDRETEGHTQRVTAGTMQLARAMGFTDEELVHIRRGALLHDIGKMGVPDAILLKANDLTEEERAVMQRHPQYAYDMLSRIAYLEKALAIPYCHHEKWDGSGYPRGLKGHEIPLAARIFAVMDVYDALTSDRPYRKRWTEEAALRYIQEQAGVHFDPKVVRVFLGMRNDLASASARALHE